jgi:hypothetical protein
VRHFKEPAIRPLTPAANGEIADRLLLVRWDQPCLFPAMDGRLGRAKLTGQTLLRKAKDHAADMLHRIHGTVYT